MDNISPVQLVFYTNIEEVRGDLIPEVLPPYYDTFAVLMEDKDFRTFAWEFPQLGLPPSSTWNDTETSPSSLKLPNRLPLPKIFALATAPLLRDGVPEIFKEENTVLRHEIYAILIVFWEAFSLHSRHWGWALRRFFQVKTLLSPNRPLTATSS